MAQTPAKRAAANKEPSTGRARAATTKKKPPSRRDGAAAKPAEDRVRRALGGGTDLSEQVLRSLESGQKAAVEAVRDFVEAVDRVLPPRGEGPSRAEEVVDSALKMSERLVHAQYDFLRNVIHSAGKAVGDGERPAKAK